eukprot:3001836-Rhodomonas_salina.1
MPYGFAACQRDTPSDYVPNLLRPLLAARLNNFYPLSSFPGVQQFGLASEHCFDTSSFRTELSFTYSVDVFVILLTYPRGRVEMEGGIW